MYNEGISKEGDILDLGVGMNIIEKRGAFFRYRDGMLGQGRENAKNFLRENPTIAYEIEMVIRENSASLTSLSVAAAGAEEEAAAAVGGYEE